MAFQPAHDANFVGLQPPVQSLASARPDFQERLEIAVGECVDDFRMNIRISAYGAGVHEAARDVINNGVDDAGAFRMTLAGLELCELNGRHLGGAPGTKLSGTEVAAACRPDVVVDVLRPDLMSLSIFVEVLEKLLARKLLERPDRMCNAPVMVAEAPFLARFSLKLKWTVDPSIFT